MNPLVALPTRIGIRESRHAVCLHTLTEHEVLSGERFPDAIANGTYRVDVHQADGPGIIFRYLDGREEYATSDFEHEWRRWRPETSRQPDILPDSLSLAGAAGRDERTGGRALAGCRRGAPLVLCV